VHLVQLYGIGRVANFKRCQRKNPHQYHEETNSLSSRSLDSNRVNQPPSKICEQDSDGKKRNR